MPNAYASPTIGRGLAVADSAGELIINLFVFDMAAAYAPAQQPAAGVVANLDTLQIGVVPAGEKLVPHLCMLDETAVLAVANDIGTSAVVNALMAGGPVAAAVKLGKDFNVIADIGDGIVDVPIYITFNAGGNVPNVGKIYFYQVTRAIRDSFDNMEVGGS